MPSGFPDLRRLASNVGVALAATLVAFLLAEGLLRLLFPKGGADRISSIEYSHAWKLNSDGYRDEEFAAKIARGRKNLVFVGDSFIAGMGCELEKTFGWAIARRLDGRFETFNLGRIITGTKAHRNALAEHLGEIRPAAVVLFFYWNDVQDNLYYDEDDPETAAMVREENAKQRPFFPVLQPLKNFLRDSTLYQFLSVQYRILMARFGVAKLDYDIELSLFEKESRLPAVARAWEVTERLLAETKAVCDRHGAPLLVVYVPKREQLTRWENLLKFYGVDPAQYDRFLVNRKLEPLCRRLGVPYIDVTPELDARPEKKDSWYYRFDTHFTEKGNRVFADALFPRLEAALSEAVS
jgi:hypothetical protein